MSLLTLSKALSSTEGINLHPIDATLASQKSNSSSLGFGGSVDKFGVKEIYPTKPGGREWFINMSNPRQDPLLDITNNVSISRQSDGSWLINNSQIRINVITPRGENPWKNIEMTGYIKVVSSPLAGNNSGIENNNNGEETQAIEPGLDWFARGTRHNDATPCLGTALHGDIKINGSAFWKKEIWHTGGYTDARDSKNVTSSILGRWIGWKVIMYNIHRNAAVKMESYLDDNSNNNWKKVSDVVDNGGWFATSSKKKFSSAHCGRPRDYIITNSGPVATFRSDNIAWIFKDLSIREIKPPAH